mgnify:FL=1|tara:strand:+ start:4961 stop:6667 length:1707 start_codon:yes stop_codon:yes gene_type:complete
MSQSTNPNESMDSGAMTTSPSPVSAGDIPDLLKIGAMTTDTEMNVVTDVLDPVVQNDQFMRFSFQNKGILHSMSKINFGMLSPSSSCIFPLNIGVYSLLKRVSLKIGAKTICEIDDFNYFMGYKSLFVGNEAMKEREQVLTGRIMNFGFEYLSQKIDGDDKFQFGVRNTGDGGSPHENYTLAGQNVIGNSLAEHITLDNGFDSMISTGTVNGAPEAGATVTRTFPNKVGTGMAAPVSTGRAIYQSAFWTELKRDDGDDNPSFQVSIADLCPFLRVNQLPLYMMKELVELEIQMSDPGDRVFTFNQDGFEAQIDTTQTQLIADYIYYPQDMMMSYQQANPNLTFTYVDYRLSKFTVASAGGQMSTGMTIRNVGGAGRIITRVFFGVENKDRGSADLFNTYNAVAPARTYVTPVTNANYEANSNGQATINLKYNDDFLFPIDVTNSARHFHNTAESEGLVPFTTRECYSRQGESLTPSEFRCASSVVTHVGGNGAPINTNLSGQQFYVGLKLSDNERINSRGIELYYQTTGSGDGDAGPANFVNGAVQRCWLETVRQVSLTDGFVSVSYA